MQELGTMQFSSVLNS